MSFQGFQTVVKGEASETDDEEELYVSSVPSSSFSSLCGVKVQGEASETDDDDEDPAEKIKPPPRTIPKDLPPLVVMRDIGEDSPVGLEEKPTVNIRQQGRYSSLLQQKLLESNARLYHDVNNAIRQVYHTATSEIRTLTSQLSNSQTGIINASHSIRLALEDLKGVLEKIDIITTCNLLPDIQI
ncbi:biogenesis of lysosome-related organelles complex 1 subunit 3 [Bombina bombina]|uniref:biogenesis of lysosome-related organelles complex 1 subunit 3 n=1 Tax=Bombina bombina TaxID=8345 RepID=UPI00235A8CD9|nr:biogenesis of lysosome-related organelles complex 1 subunit 3 [Bombina bombina]XP_053545189.1 biogenesis of lysosome-related organelles complex 1 subunit 3 [Bombina bombina]